MMEVQQILFMAILILFGILLWRRIAFLKAAIQMGQPLDRTDQPAERWRRVLLLAFGQKKMFRRWIPAMMHLVLYLGFIIINIEVLEFIIDGIGGRHRTFAGWLNAVSGAGDYHFLYHVVMNIFEFLALGVIIACVVFLIRRNLLKLSRFKGEEMTRWPRLDANLILIFEIILMLAILLMNASDQELQKTFADHYPQTGTLLISQTTMVPLIDHLPADTLISIERGAWWFHILGILGFALYVTYSKHLHIILAFPNTYYASLKSPAEIPPMEIVTREVRMMLGMPASADVQEGVDPPSTLGARAVQDLHWKNIMDAFTCTECGRCTAVCPAHITGKKLSPRKIMMDIRDTAELTMRSRKENGEMPLLFDRISREELFACTTCNACIDACPVSIDPVSIIIEMRRYTVMEESSAPNAWNMMFNNLETSFAPWKFPASDRFKWAQEISKKG